MGFRNEDLAGAVVHHSVTIAGIAFGRIGRVQWAATGAVIDDHLTTSRLIDGGRWGRRRRGRASGPGVWNPRGRSGLTFPSYGPRASSGDFGRDVTFGEMQGGAPELADQRDRGRLVRAQGSGARDSADIGRTLLSKAMMKHEGRGLISGEYGSHLQPTTVLGASQPNLQAGRSCLATGSMTLDRIVGILDRNIGGNRERAWVALDVEIERSGRIELEVHRTAPWVQSFLGGPCGQRGAWCNFSRFSVRRQRATPLLLAC